MLFPLFPLIKKQCLMQVLMMATTSAITKETRPTKLPKIEDQIYSLYCYYESTCITFICFLKPSTIARKRRMSLLFNSSGSCCQWRRQIYCIDWCCRVNRCLIVCGQMFTLTCNAPPCQFHQSICVRRHGRFSLFSLENCNHFVIH